MGLFNRVVSTERSGLPQVGRQGQGLLGNISITTKATNTNHTLTVAEMAGGMVYYDSLSAGREVTVPTAAAILAEAPDMDIGDSFTFVVSIQDGFAITWVTNTGVTLAGRTTTPASSFSLITVTKLTATTVQWHVS